MRTDDDAGVSEVIGSVILVAISVVVLGGLGVAILSAVTSDTATSPVGAFSMMPRAGDSFVDVTFVSGSPFPLDGARVILLVEGAPPATSYVMNSTATDGLFHPSDRLRIDLTAPLAPGTNLTLLVNHRETGRSIGMAYATIPAVAQLPAYVADVPRILSASTSPALVSTGASSSAALSVEIDASRGLALVASVTANLSRLGLGAFVPLMDDGQAGDALAGDGNYSLALSALSHVFSSSNGTETVPVVVTVTDILGHTANLTLQVTLQPPPQPPVTMGATYAPILSSTELGWLNLTAFSYRDITALDGDTILVHVSDDADASKGWSALVRFGYASCSNVPSVRSVVYTLDGVAGNATWTPSGGCFPIGSSSTITQLDLAVIGQSKTSTGSVPAWSGTAGGFNYSDAGIGAANHAVVTYFGDSQSVDPGATGLSQATLTWGPGANNVAPTASWIVTHAPDTSPYLQVSANAGGSSDPDGTIASYDWDWGDGTTHGSGATASHTYASAAVRTITLTVTDNGGASDSLARVVVADRAPTASFTNTTTLLTVNVDASATTDPDAGQNVTYAWDWGDASSDAASASPTASHTYATGGNYTIVLTARDNFGTPGVALGVVQPDRPPSIDATATSTNNRTAFLNVTASDPDGQNIGYVVTWGDGSVSASGNGAFANFSHAYATNGVYAARLFVNDTLGASATAFFNFTAALNQPPTISAFSAATNVLVAFVNASASDPDVEAIGYVVAWGDGTTSSAGNLSSIALSHTFTAGNYTLTLFVNDTRGGSSSQASAIQANAPPVIASATGAQSNLTAFLNVTASDPDGQSIGYEVAWGDGSTSAAGNGATAALSHAFAANGTYTATLFVNDSFGASASTTVVYTLVQNHPPAITALSSATSNLTAFVNLSASDPNGDAISYAIVWGDGSAPTTAGNVASVNGAHTYAATGSYTVTIYVNDTNGGSTVSTLTISPATAPSAPSSLAAASGNAQVSLSWSAPASNGGSAITAYKVYRGTTTGGETLLNGNVPAGNTTYVDANGLTNGVAYFYKITAVNAVGESAQSNEASATPSTTPTAPQSLAATRGNAQVTLTWSAPASNGGASVTSYKIYRGTTSGGETLLNGNVPAANTSYVDANGLINGNTYYYKLSAVNSVGEGAQSSEVSATPATTPGAPTGLTATGGANQVSLSWTAPASNGGSALTNYKIYRGSTSGGETLLDTIGTNTSYVSAGLTGGVTYYYKVSAVNAVGEGAQSSEASATALSAPSAPLNPRATPANHQIAVSWSAPSSNGGSAIANYKIYRSTTSGAETLLATIGTNTSFTDKTAVNGTTYYYKISAVNAASAEGPQSAEVSATPSATIEIDCSSYVVTSGTLDSCTALWFSNAGQGNVAETGTSGPTKEANITFTMNVTGVTGIQTMEIRGQRNNAPENLLVQALNTTSGAYDVIATLDSSFTSATTFSGTINMQYYASAGGTLTIRLKDNGPDSNNSSWIVDYVRLVTA